MKQPELGKKISELRKSKRWTQEELVEKCNISIRTIQRLEAGEVTPRDYTIRTILNALGYDLDQIPANNIGTLAKGSKVNASSLSKQAQQLYMAGIFGIAFFVIRFFEGVVEYSRFEGTMSIEIHYYIIVKLAIVILFIFFQHGFIQYGVIVENYLLKIASQVYIGVTAILIGLDLLSILLDYQVLELIILTYAVGFGATGLLFGYALFKIEGPLKRIARISGFFEIIAACSSLTIVISFFAPFILIPAELLQIIILFRAADLIQKGRIE